MDHLASFFGKFKKFLSAGVLEREMISKAVLAHANVSVHPQHIQIKNQVAYLKCSFVEKNEIFLHKSSILEEIKKAGVLGIKDIR